MESQQSASLFYEILRGGAGNLERHVDEVNDLNVFPIPDGDTGSNMLLTSLGGANVAPKDEESLIDYARRVADGVLFSARGNSGVILSQFTEGIAEGIKKCDSSSEQYLTDVFRSGVKYSYAAVSEPVEGTILTVMREATDYAAEGGEVSLKGFLTDFVAGAKKSLATTPDLLPVLKKAGVIDSGGAGLIYIAEGMLSVLNGEAPSESISSFGKSNDAVDFDGFTEDSVLEFGYCTEVLLRLQNAKTDIEHFDASVIRNYLQTVGNSVVCFQNGSIVKMHVHTSEPYKVLEFLKQYGEYLSVKIENMSLQHNNLLSEAKDSARQDPKEFGVVAVAYGDGIKKAFREMGADVIIEGTNGKNPSVDEYVKAYDVVNAKTIFVLPDNGNAIMAARQAAELFSGSDIRVLESTNIGEGYAALSMLNFESHDADEIEAELNEAINGVICAAISKCVKDTEMDGFLLSAGQYIGFMGKKIVSADNDRQGTACMLLDMLDFADHEVCILIRGKNADEQEAEEIVAHVRQKHPMCETYILDGGQDVYDYVCVIE